MEYIYTAAAAKSTMHKIGKQEPTKKNMQVKRRRQRPLPIFSDICGKMATAPVIPSGHIPLPLLL